MADGWIELDPKKLDTHEGVAELNRMLQLLFDTIAGDGNKQRVFSGSGTPEGSVVADIGSLYMRLDGGTDTAVYKKESGVQTATGWVAIGAGGGGGEANTASNVGSGQGTIFKQKTGVDLEFKSLLEGANVDLTNNTSDITIKAIPSGSDTEIQFNDGGTTFGSDTHFKWNKTTNTLTLDSDAIIRSSDVSGGSSSSGSLSILTGQVSGGGTGAGGIIEIEAGSSGAGDGGYITIEAGASSASGIPGDVTIIAGSGGTGGGYLELTAGSSGATNGDGGWVTILGGNGSGTGLGGLVEIRGDGHTYNADPGTWYQILHNHANITIASGITATFFAGTYFDTFNMNGIAGGATETVTTGATVYIQNAPGGTNITYTNGPYALMVDAGLCRFDGNGTNVFELPADATDPTAGGGAATGRIPVLIGGATRYLAYY